MCWSVLAWEAGNKFLCQCMGQLMLPNDPVFQSKSLLTVLVDWSTFIWNEWSQTHSCWPCLVKDEAKSVTGCGALTSSSGEGGSGMGMSRGALREAVSVMLKPSSWQNNQIKDKHKDKSEEQFSQIKGHRGCQLKCFTLSRESSFMIFRGMKSEKRVSAWKHTHTHTKRGLKSLLSHKSWFISIFY